MALDYAWIGLAISSATGIGALVWRAGQTVARVEVELRHLAEAIRALRDSAEDAGSRLSRMESRMAASRRIVDAIEADVERMMEERKPVQ
jgi:hypothetical protein